MNFIDVIIILYLLIAGYIGYKRGFFKELYSILIVILSILFSFLTANIVGRLVLNMINLEGIKDNQAYGLLENQLASYIGLIVSYFLIYFILKLVVAILIKKKILPTNLEYFRYGGTIIHILETLFTISIMGFVLSFGSYINQDYYSRSLLIKPIYRLNFPLYNYGIKLHEIIDNGIDIANRIDQYREDPSQLFTDPKSTETIKLLYETGIINDDLIVESSKELFKNTNSEEVKLNKKDLNKLQADEKFQYFKNLYDEGVVTEKLLRRIVTENNLTNFDIDGLIELLEE